MGNDDRASDNERDRHGLLELFARHLLFVAAVEVVGDTVVTAQHTARHQAKQFFGFDIERAIFVAHRIEVEKTLDPLTKKLDIVSLFEESHSLKDLLDHHDARENVFLFSVLDEIVPENSRRCILEQMCRHQNEVLLEAGNIE